MITLKAPEGCNEINVGPDKYKVDGEGCITVPDHMASNLRVHGFKRAEAGPKSPGHTNAPEPEITRPTDNGFGTQKAPWEQ